MTNSTAHALSPASAATELYSPRRWVYTVLELPSAPSKSRDAQVLTDIDELSLRGRVPVFTAASSNISRPVHRRLLAFRTKAEYAAFIRILHSTAVAGGASPEFLAALLPKPGMVVHHAQNSEMGIVYGLLGRYGFMDLPVTGAAEPPRQHVDFSSYANINKQLQGWLRDRVFVSGEVTLSCWVVELPVLDSILLRVYLEIASDSKFDGIGVADFEFRTSGGEIHGAVTAHSVRTQGGTLITMPVPARALPAGQHSIGDLPATSSELLRTLAKYLTAYMTHAAKHINDIVSAGRAHAAAEPPKHVYTVMPSIHVVTTLSPYETHGHAVFTGVRDKLTEALHQFGFHPEDAEIELVHVADGDDEHEDDEDWRYTTGKMVFNGRPGQELQAFKALLAYLTQHQDNLSIHIEPTWAHDITESFVHGLEHPGHYTPAVVTIGAAEPTPEPDDFFSRASGHTGTIHVRIPFACPPAADTPNNSVDDWLRYDVQNAAKASLRGTGLQNTYSYIDVPIVHDGSNHRRRYLVYNWIPDSAAVFKAGLHKYITAIRQQFPEINAAEIAKRIVDSVRSAVANSRTRPPSQNGIHVDLPGGTYELHLPNKTVEAAAEPSTHESEYIKWFRSQLKPGAERNDVRIRYDGMDLTLVSLYTARADSLKYGVYGATGKEAALTIQFFNASATISSTNGTTVVAAASTLQRTLLAVLREFDKNVVQHVITRLRNVNAHFYERFGDVHCKVIGDQLKVKVTAGDGLWEDPGPELTFSLEQLREWIWSPGHRGWHDNIVAACQEAWSKYQVSA